MHSLVKVVLQCWGILGLLFAEQGDNCMTLKENCCFYENIYPYAHAARLMSGAPKIETHAFLSHVLCLTKVPSLYFLKQSYAELACITALFSPLTLRLSHHWRLEL